MASIVDDLGLEGSVLDGLAASLPAVAGLPLLESTSYPEANR